MAVFAKTSNISKSLLEKATIPLLALTYRQEGRPCVAVNFEPFTSTKTRKRRFNRFDMFDLGCVCIWLVNLCAEVFIRVAVQKTARKSKSASFRWTDEQLLGSSKPYSSALLAASVATPGAFWYGATQNLEQVTRTSH